MTAATAGITAAEVFAPDGAQAAAGDNLILGQGNDSGTAPTSLISTAATRPSLTVANTADHAPLLLAQQASSSFTPLGGGELANLDGYLYNTFDFGGTTGPMQGFVYTEVTANQVVTIRPQRILDTRTSSGRAHILNPSGNLDSSGRLLGGRTINVSLSSLEVAAERPSAT